MDEPYVQIPKALAKDPALGHAALHVYLLLACYANREGECWPATRTLGGQLNLSRATVAFHLRSLEARGYLTIERATGRPSRFHLYSGPNRVSDSLTTGRVTHPHRVNGSLGVDEPLTHPGRVVHSPTLNENLKNENKERDSVNERVRTADADAPPAAHPRTRKHLFDPTALLAAFQTCGLSAPHFVGKEAAAARALLAAFPPADIAGCWSDYAHGQRGDAWEHERLSFALLADNNRLANWQTWRDQGKPTSEQRNGATRQRSPGSLHPTPAAGAAGSRRGSGVGIIIPDDAERARLDALTFRPGASE